MQGVGDPGWGPLRKTGNGTVRQAAIWGLLRSRPRESPAQVISLGSKSRSNSWDGGSLWRKARLTTKGAAPRELHRAVLFGPPAPWLAAQWFLNRTHPQTMGLSMVLPSSPDHISAAANSGELALMLVMPVGPHEWLV